MDAAGFGVDAQCLARLFSAPPENRGDRAAATAVLRSDVDCRGTVVSVVGEDRAHPARAASHPTSVPANVPSPPADDAPPRSRRAL